MNERIEQIKARLDKATPGPWEILSAVTQPPTIGTSSGIAIAHGYRRETAEFIAHAPDDLKFLLEAVKESEERLKEEYRINGMGAQRELKLETQFRIAREALEYYRERSNVPMSAIVNAYMTNGSTHDAMTAYTAKAREALEKIKEMK